MVSNCIKFTFIIFISYGDGGCSDKKIGKQASQPKNQRILSKILSRLLLPFCIQKIC